MSRKVIKSIGWMGTKVKMDAEDVDPEIRDLVLDLNRHGFRTYSSCAGDTYLTGEVSLASLRPSPSREEYKEIKDIVRLHTDIPFHLVRQKGKAGTMIVFRRPLGGIPEWAPTKDQPYIPDTVLLDLSTEEVGRPLKESTPTDEEVKEILKDESFWEN